jgi:hypothetical protein
MNGQTDRPEYKCVCFDIWYDPEDAEKTVSNMKAHFFNKRKATWDKEKGAGSLEQESQSKGFRGQGQWGDQGWGKQQEGGKGFQGGWGAHKKEEWGKGDWASQ